MVFPLDTGRKSETQGGSNMKGELQWNLQYKVHLQNDLVALNYHKNCAVKY